MRRIDRAALRRAAGVLVLAGCLGAGQGTARAGDPAPPPRPTQSELVTARTAQSAQPTGARTAAAAALLTTPEDRVASGLVVPGVAARVAAAATTAPGQPPVPRLAAATVAVPTGFAASGLKGTASARSAEGAAFDPAAAGVVTE